MKKVLVFVLVVAVVVIVAAIVKADGRANYGVISEERIVNLPEDGGRWFISVIGNRDNRQYNVLLNWFESSAKLNKVKVQVHFWRVDSDSPLYAKRFASNLNGLPAIRVQKPDGVVVYQATGNNIPVSAEGLYGALADAINPQDTEQQCPDGGNCPLRPRPRPRPEPTPEPEPDVPDTTPIVPDTAPIVVPDTTPVVEPMKDEGLPPLLIIGIVAACVIVGGAIGLVSQWKKTYNL